MDSHSKGLPMAEYDECPSIGKELTNQYQCMSFVQYPAITAYRLDVM